MSITGPRRRAACPRSARRHAEAGRRSPRRCRRRSCGSSCVMSVERKSTPPTSRRWRARALAISRLSGWMTSSRRCGAPGGEVRGSERRYTTCPASGHRLWRSPARPSILSAWASISRPRQHLLVADAAARILVHELDEFDDLAAAVPNHVTGVRRVAATSSPFTTSRRWSSHSRKVSTITERECSRRHGKALRDLSSVVRRMEMPRPWLPL